MTHADERLLKLLREARGKLASERARRNEPIAIVGMGCRFPGGASSPEAFWQLLVSGVDATTDIPPERWNAEALYDTDPAAQGKCYVRRGAFLDGIDAFEPEFFGISPREAVALDPQQRLLLEVAWEAIEDAGIPVNTLRGSASGVWIGLTLDDYAVRGWSSGDLTRIDPYSTLGTARSVAAGRIAYLLDLRGPVMQIDTSCSSSIVALHLACQSLRSRECELALVGGVNLMSASESMIALCKLRALAPDGRCKTFDAAADGYGRGEGCGVVVLKRVSDARAAGDQIHAVVRGSAINHDGQSNGLTAPNGAAQEAVIRSALANAGLEPSEVDYVETHGTGTSLGDPIEVLALGRVYGQGRTRDRPLYLGSVKTCLGHLEGAAGIVSLVKAALCVSRAHLTPHLNLRAPNPTIPWDQLPVRVVTGNMDWPSTGAARVAGVSSFGISGTNAHVLVEQAPAAPSRPSSPVRSAELVVISAKTGAALAALAGQLAARMRSDPETTLGDFAFNLATTRSLMDRRIALVVPSRHVLQIELEELAERAERAGAANAREAQGKLAWIFSGQGAQRAGMGRGLYDEWPAFRDALDGVFAAMADHLDRPLRDVMWADQGSADSDLLNATAYTQPALFAFEWALAALWRSWGVEPSVVSGHSIGEITAACVAGVFSLDDAARLVCARGRLMQALPGGGAMVAIAAPEAAVLEAIERYGESVAIAAINGPSSVVISGDERLVMTIASYFATRPVEIKRLSVSHAFHSALMEPMAGPFMAVAESVRYRNPSRLIVSNVTGRLAGPEIATPGYWARHVRAPVRFSDGIRALATAGCTTFIEMGPKSTLLPLVHACLSKHAVLLSSAGAGRSETQAALVALAGWVMQGGTLDWAGVFPGGGRRVDLPRYPWQRKRYWLEPAPRQQNPPVSSTWAALGTPLQTADADLPHGKDDVAVESPPMDDDQRLARWTEIVRASVARVLAVSDPTTVPLHTPLGELGIDSLMALELSSALRRRARESLPVDVRIQHASVFGIAVQLTDHLRWGEPRAANSTARCEKMNDVTNPAVRLVCFHDAGGSAAMFAPFSELAASGVEVHSASHDRATAPSAASAERYLRDVVAYVRRGSDRPYVFFGHSLGSIFAWRVVQELDAVGAPLPGLFIASGSRAPQATDTFSEMDLAEMFRGVFRGAAEAMPSLRGDVYADLLLLAAMPDRGCRPLDVPIAALRGVDDHVASENDMMLWAERTTKNFSIATLPGDHFYLSHPQSLRLVIVALTTTLARLPRAHQP